MIKTVLWDLDGTLLPMNMDYFLKHYFKKISEHVAHLIEPREVLKHLMAATDVMMKDETPKTNEEVFYEAFSKRVNHLTEDLYKSFEGFYKNEFRELVAYTKPTGLARTMIKDLHEKGYKYVLATNPIFPLDAIRARMEWAGIDDFPWSWITSYENSRYCKPNTKYYEDILSKTGNTPEECMMVGNNPMDDIIAGKLGVKTFLVEGENTETEGSAYSEGRETPTVLIQPNRTGTLEELAEYIRNMPPVD